MAAELRGFGQERPTLVAPQSSLDTQRAALIGQFNQLLGGGAAPAAALPAAGAQALGLIGVPHLPDAQTGEQAGQSVKPRFCHQCGERAEPDARFCGACGTGLAV
jgi:hypothetical protein